ncbi:MAG TPA: serine/threonine-protein kinase, partial [Polyangiaceae bacterium]
MKRCTLCRTLTRKEVPQCLRCEGGAFDDASVEVIDDRYAVERVLGQGGMGVVYLAHDLDLARPVALKTITPQRAHSARLRHLLRREAAALATIRHPHVVQVHSFGPHRQGVFFAMEWVRGATLQELLDESRKSPVPVPIHRALRVILCVADGLAAVHTAGLVHCDVKPANIVIEEGTGRPVLVDFGLARPLVAGPLRESVGTPCYMAPEQSPRRREDVLMSPASDVYSL